MDLLMPVGAFPGECFGMVPTLVRLRHLQGRVSERITLRPLAELQGRVSERITRRPIEALPGEVLGRELP